MLSPCCVTSVDGVKVQHFCASHISRSPSIHAIAVKCETVYTYRNARTPCDIFLTFPLTLLQHAAAKTKLSYHCHKWAFLSLRFSRYSAFCSTRPYSIDSDDTKLWSYLSFSLCDCDLAGFERPRCLLNLKNENG